MRTFGKIAGFVLGCSRPIQPSPHFNPIHSPHPIQPHLPPNPNQYLYQYQLIQINPPFISILINPLFISILIPPPYQYKSLIYLYQSKSIFIPIQINPSFIPIQINIYIKSLHISILSSLSSWANWGLAKII